MERLEHSSNTPTYTRRGAELSFDHTEQEIVRRVEGLFALTDQLEARLPKAHGQVGVKLDTSPLILSPFEAERKAHPRAWTHSLPTRSDCTVLLCENRLACSQPARLAGQLVPQDPNNEPGSVLLQRIHAHQHS
jgi:hypothetical protein